jgi:PAS domain S-box-containing protein
MPHHFLESFLPQDPSATNLPTRESDQNTSPFDVETLLLYTAYSRDKANLWIAFLIAPVGLILLKPHFSLTVLLIWAGAVWFGVAWGVVQMRAFYRAVPQGNSILKWKRYFVSHGVVAALAWSLVPAWLIGTGAVGSVVLLVTPLLAICTVGMVSIAYSKRSMQVFVSLTLLPVALAALLSPFEVNQLLGVELLIGLAVLLWVGTMSAQVLQRQVESQLRLQSVVDNADEAVITFNHLGNIAGWNPEAEQLFGFKRQEVLGWPLDDAVELHTPTPDKRLGWAELVQWPTANTSSRQELVVVKNGKVKVPVEVSISHSSSGNSRLITAFIRDISQHKNERETLALFRQLVERSSQCVAIADVHRQGIFQNKAHRDTMGYSDEEVKNLLFRDVLPPEQADLLEADVTQALLADGVWEGQLPMRRKNGSQFISNSSIATISNAQGHIQYTFNIFSDMSDVLAQRTELQLAKDDAERANHAKSQFISSMSHELRTPLNAILGFAQLLQMDKNLRPDQTESVVQIGRGGQHLLKLVNQVLDLAKIESGTLDLSIEDVELASLVSECWRLISPLAQPAKLQYHASIAQAHGVRADRVRLKQVLINLLSNAIKYNRFGGDVSVRTIATDAQWLRLEVTDTGAGIDAKRLKEVFQPFNRLAEHKSTEGTGIGLSITEQLVGQMGGMVGVHSKVGEGATFWVELPSVKITRPAPQAPAALKAAAPATPTHFQVLSIDDNPVNLTLLERILAKRPSIQLTSAQNPGQGIQLALNNKPDLILLDINMPGMDGYQVLEVLKSYERTKDIPVIAVTANTSPFNWETNASQGLDGYITKPIDVPLFLQMLDSYLPGSTSATPPDILVD